MKTNKQTWSKHTLARLECLQLVCNTHDINARWSSTCLLLFTVSLGIFRGGSPKSCVVGYVCVERNGLWEEIPSALNGYVTFQWRPWSLWSVVCTFNLTYYIYNRDLYLEV